MASIARHVNYIVRRNSRGSLPVYSDIRNAGTRCLLEIRNVEGNANALAQDLRQSLAQHTHLAVSVRHQRHVVLAGGRCKRDVVAWLTSKGF